MNRLFELITEFIEITGNSTVDTVLLWIIGIISFLVAFGIVGMIFDAIGIYDSDIMSYCHWVIRLLVFLGLSFICICISKFISWLFSFQWWVYLILFIILTGLIISIYYFKHKYSMNKIKALVKVKISEGPNIEKQSEDPIIITRDFCPRCGGRLVKRHGPYGDFYGCENFSTKDCRYTRKYI